VTLNGSLQVGSAVAKVSSTSGLGVGYQVTGTGIPTGTTISQIGSDGAQLTLSQVSTASGMESLVFTPTIAPPQIVALVQPPGGVVTPPSSSPLGPLTISPGSQGFNASGVYDYLASTKDANGNPLQAFGLSFYGQGLASLAQGGIFKFSLDVANQNSPPQLVSQTPGVSITLQQPADGTGGTNTGTGGTTQTSPNETPEPLSMLIWSTLVAGSLLRSQRLRSFVSSFKPRSLRR
jgi:hypothetical protein